MKKYPYIFAGLIMLSGCTTIENTLVGPPADITPDLPEIPSEWVKAGVVGEVPVGNWLEVFDDPMMIALVNEAMESNPTIRASEARVRAAKQQARAVFGRSLPSASYSFDNGYSTVVNSQTLGGGVVVDGRFSQPSYRQSLDLAWELDLWGRVRAENQAARTDFFATEADLAAAQLSLGGQTATAWIDLNAALEQVRIARETFDANKRIVELTERRFERGLSTALDVRTARTQLATSEAQIAAQEQIRANAVRRLEVLLGRYPSAELEAPSVLPTLDPIESSGNPLLLLTRRPDIAAAEARVEAAGLRAEQARLGILPAFRASGSVFNSSSIEFGDIFDIDRISANVFGSLTQTIWAGGALRAEKRAAVANAEALAADYTNTVLTAWREVEDALDADVFLETQLNAQIRALEEARLAEELATRQYQNGLVSIFNLIQSQITRFGSEASAISAAQARANNRINYYMALGGSEYVEPEEGATYTAQLTESSDS
ncbi:MAG: efflux transporter outer membrane subunit [Pseudomonadota bacterium]